MSIERQLSAAEVGKIIGVASRTVRRRKEQFAGWWYDGHSIRIPESSVERYIEARRGVEPRVEVLPGPPTPRASVEDFSRAVRRFRDELCGISPRRR